MTDQTETAGAKDFVFSEIRHGNKNPRNLYSGPGAEHHFAVVVGDLDHAAVVSGWLAEAARAYIAAGHPMPEPPSTSEETIERAARMLRLHLPTDRAQEAAEAMAAGGLLADPEQATEMDDLRQHVRNVGAQRDVEKAENERLSADLKRFVDRNLSLRAERDLLLWLHAEATWWLAQYQRDVVTAWKPERDELQGRIDAALAVLDEPVPATPHGANAIWKIQNNHALRIVKVREALQGDQPGQGASPGPHHPAGSPEAHFPTDPQMPGSVSHDTPASTLASPQAAPSVQASGEAGVRQYGADYQSMRICGDNVHHHEYVATDREVADG